MPMADVPMLGTDADGESLSPMLATCALRPSIRARIWFRRKAVPVAGLAACALLVLALVALSGTSNHVARAPFGRDRVSLAGDNVPAAAALGGAKGQAPPEAGHKAAAAAAAEAEPAAGKHGAGHPHNKRSAKKPKLCANMWGVILAQGKSKDAWPQCAPKWSTNCKNSGCCSDWGMKCFEKNDAWAACNNECKQKDEKNETWSCKAVWPPRPRTAETCSQECQERAGCRSAVFSSDGGGSCKLAQTLFTQVVWASDVVNSTICADSAEKLKQLTQEVNKQLPFTLPQETIRNCSWGGEDCAATKCCNDVDCDKDFTGCYSYSCYKKTEYFSGCSLHAPPKDWDGTWLGGGREKRVIGPAGSTVKVMGNTLYCFSVVSWDAPRPKAFWSTEKELALNIQQNRLSIEQCDGHGWYSGQQTAKAEWGSFSNIDAFQATWNAVKWDGNYSKYDWTVKVDVDAVFIPERLKWHLDKLRVPFGARVYIENNDYRFKFMGALEIASKPAIEIFLQRGSSCIRGKHEGGEDFFMKGCMDALGIDHMIDHQLLHDKYGGQDWPCNDGWAVAYHFHKKVISWNWCYNEAMCGSRGKTCPKGMEVEYTMPWTAR